MKGSHTGKSFTGKENKSFVCHFLRSIFTMRQTRSCSRFNRLHFFVHNHSLSQIFRKNKTGARTSVISTYHVVSERSLIWRQDMILREIHRYILDTLKYCMFNIPWTMVSPNKSEAILVVLTWYNTYYKVQIINQTHCPNSESHSCPNSRRI